METKNSPFTDKTKRKTQQVFSLVANKIIENKLSEIIFFQSRLHDRILDGTEDEFDILRICLINWRSKMSFAKTRQKKNT